MLGLFGTLNLGQRALQAQRQGVEVTGHNLANVNQPGYTRQRLVMQSSGAVPTSLGPQGTGVESVAIQQVRDGLLDRQVRRETSVSGSLNAQQQALQLAQASLGLQVDRQAQGASAAEGAQGLSGANSLAEGLSDLFAAFQNLSTQPASLDARQAAIQKAQTLANQFNQASQRLGELNSTLNDSVQADVDSANTLLKDIAQLNRDILDAEGGEPGSANDLRDMRQQKIEELAKFVKIDAAEAGNGAVTVSIAGADFVSNGAVQDTLEAYDTGGGNFGVRAKTAATPLTLTGGSLHGTMEARDGALTDLRTRLDTLASTLISEVNAAHAAGFNLSGSNGAAFFQGTRAADIRVNQALADDPSLIQASGVAGARSDNQAALALAQLAGKSHAALGGQTFNGHLGQTAGGLGEALAGVNRELESQHVLEQMLQRQRDAISGVSLDEEMTNLVKYQKAFEASAKLINIVDEMLDTVLNLKQ